MSSDRFSNDRPKQEFLCHFCDEPLPTLNDVRIHLNICASKTDQCPYCKRYILRSIFAYHIDNNCTNPNLFNEKENSVNASSSQEETTTSKKFESLFEKQAHMYEQLDEVCYETEKNHVAEKLQFNIIIMGSPRVGKSELINALCDGNQAKTSSSLDSCTQKITCYTLEDDQQRNPSVKPFKINFYDTPGIESWEKKAGELTMIEFIEKTNPVCMIYCASPGSYANLNQLHSILEYCQTKRIFCALVCTNMWSSSKRHDVINDFEKQLAFFGDKVEKESVQGQYPSPHKIIFFGEDALCTMVNSKEYSDKDLLGNQIMPVQGIDELIHGIMEALDQEKILGWCYAVLYRRSYWEKIQQKVGGFFQLRFTYLYNLIALSYDVTAKNFAAYFQKQLASKKES